MNRPQAKLTDILGERKPCYFSSQGERPFRYSDKCRTCTIELSYGCNNYLPSRQSKPEDPLRPKGFDSQSTTDNNLLATGVDKTADNYIPIIIRNNQTLSRTQRVLDWIRRYNDGGAM